MPAFGQGVDAIKVPTGFLLTSRRASSGGMSDRSDHCRNWDFLGSDSGPFSLRLVGPHGLSQIVYAYASSAADNGSAFAGLNANTPWWNVTTGIVIFLGRFAQAIPIPAIARSLAAKPPGAPSGRSPNTRSPRDGRLSKLGLSR